MEQPYLVNEKTPNPHASTATIVQTEQLCLLTGESIVTMRIRGNPWFIDYWDLPLPFTFLYNFPGYSFISKSIISLEVTNYANFN